MVLLFLAQPLVRSLTAQGAEGPVEIVEVLPLLKFGHEQLALVDDDAIELIPSPGIQEPLSPEG